MRTTRNVSITVSPVLLKEAEKVAKREGRTQSELFREALRRYVTQSQFKELQRYGMERSKDLRLKASDVPRLVQAYRRRTARTRRP